MYLEMSVWECQCPLKLLKLGEVKIKNGVTSLTVVHCNSDQPDQRRPCDVSSTNLLVLVTSPSLCTIMSKSLRPIIIVTGANG